MDLWYPPHDQPHLLEWWRPLILASRAARVDRVPWLLHLDEIQLVGRIDRSGRPPIWVYKHAESRGELYLDPTGQAYRFTRTPNARSYGRFTACDLRTAIFRAGLPTVVEPVWFEPRTTERRPVSSHDDMIGNRREFHRDDSNGQFDEQERSR